MCSQSSLQSEIFLFLHFFTLPMCQKEVFKCGEFLASGIVIKIFHVWLDCFRALIGDEFMKRVTLYLIADDFKRLFKPDFLIRQIFFHSFRYAVLSQQFICRFLQYSYFKFFFEDISEENDRF